MSVYHLIIVILLFFMIYLFLIVVTLISTHQYYKISYHYLYASINLFDSILYNIQ